MPVNSCFSDPAYLKNMRLKTQLVDVSLAREMDKHPKRAIRPIKPGQANRHLEPVVIAGVAFYLDHENQLVIPIEPETLPTHEAPLSK